MCKNLHIAIRASYKENSDQGKNGILYKNWQKNWHLTACNHRFHIPDRQHHLMTPPFKDDNVWPTMSLYSWHHHLNDVTVSMTSLCRWRCHLCKFISLHDVITLMIAEMTADPRGDVTRSISGWEIFSSVKKGMILIPVLFRSPKCPKFRPHKPEEGAR